MTTLAPKLPWSHAYSGGFPRMGGQPLPTDPDAIDYLNRVAAADGAAVEVGVAQAIDAFVRGCKADNANYAGDPTRTNWDALKACCIMAGARTISGALVPLKTPYGPELVDIENLPTPTIGNAGGSSGSWDSGNRTFSFISPAIPFPRLAFDIPLTSGKRYYVVGRLSGSLTAVNRIRLSTSLTTSDIAYNSTTGVLEGRANADGTKLEFVIQGNGTAQSIRIESLSIREDSFTPTAQGGWTSSEYSRGGTTPGLKGNGSTLYLDTNRANNADGQDDNHVATYATQGATVNSYFAGATNSTSPISYTLTGFEQFNRSGNGPAASSPSQPGLYATSRMSSSEYSWRAKGGAGTHLSPSITTAGFPTNNYVFAYSGTGGQVGAPTDARLSFYSIGSALDLAALDARTQHLMNSIRFTLLTGLNPGDYDPATLAYLLAAYTAGGSLA